MNLSFLSSLRFRLILLLLLVATPILILTIQNTLEQRERARFRAKDEAVQIARALETAAVSHKHAEEDALASLPGIFYLYAEGSEFVEAILCDRPRKTGRYTGLPPTKKNGRRRAIYEAISA